MAAFAALADQHHRLLRQWRLVKLGQRDVHAAWDVAAGEFKWLTHSIESVLVASVVVVMSLRLVLALMEEVVAAIQSSIRPFSG